MNVRTVTFTTHLASESDTRLSVRGARLIAKEAVAPLVDVPSRIDTGGMLLMQCQVPQRDIVEPLLRCRHTDRLEKIVFQYMCPGNMSVHAYMQTYGYALVSTPYQGGQFCTRTLCPPVHTALCLDLRGRRRVIVNDILRIRGVP